MPVGERPAGFAYLALLLMIAIVGLGSAAAASFWETAMRRERERELLFVGEQFRRAIQQHYENSPGTKRYPPSLEALLMDRRSPAVRRYLRRMYRDPMTGSDQWGLSVAPEGGIMGVYSLADGVPLRQAGFPGKQEHFEGARSYREWLFAYRPARQ